jgi:uncharacterized membrane protein
MIGVDLIVLQVFISLGVPDAASFVAVLAFAIGLPLLAAFIYIINDPTIDYASVISSRKPLGWLLLICLMIGFLASLIGLSAAFWHMSWIAGIIFLVSGGIAAIAVLLGLNNVSGA